MVHSNYIGSHSQVTHDSCEVSVIQEVERRKHLWILSRLIPSKFLVNWCICQSKPDVLFIGQLLRLLRGSLNCDNISIILFTSSNGLSSVCVVHIAILLSASNSFYHLLTCAT